MLHEHIAAVLPLGHVRPVYARLEGTSRPPLWVRAGDLRHGPAGFVLQPTWQGEAFQLLWDAARRRGPTGTTGPEVHFAVHVGHRLVPVATVVLDRTLLRAVRWSR